MLLAGDLVIIFVIALSTVLGIHSSPQYKVNGTGSVGNRSGLRMAITLASSPEVPQAITDHFLVCGLIR